MVASPAACADPPTYVISIEKQFPRGHFGKSEEPAGMNIDQNL
jgi:hypothetical protein